MSNSTPFFYDWTFWGSLIAGIAVILSQLPPIHRWFRSAKIELEVYSRVLLTHRIGNPNMQLHLLLRNSGGVIAKIEQIVIKIFRDNKEITVMPAKNYTAGIDTKNSVLFTRFHIKPGEDWAHEVNFLNFYSRDEEMLVRKSESLLKENIANKKELPENKDRLVRAEDDIVQPLIDLFEKKFIWKTGEYEMVIEIQTNKTKVDLSKSYRFTLFESDEADLISPKDDYATGDGIFFETGKHKPIGIPIFEP